MSISPLYSKPDRVGIEMAQIKTRDVTFDELSDVLSSLDILECNRQFITGDSSNNNDDVMKNIIEMDDYNFSERHRGLNEF